MEFSNQRRTALAAPALIILALCLLFAASVSGNRGGRSLAQEGVATPAIAATPATPIAIEFGQLVAQRPVEIHAGPCAEPGETIASLTPLETPEGEAQGQGTAIEAERSYSSVPVAIESLLAGQTSVSVLLSPEELETEIACGEIGGVSDEGGSLVVKLSPRNGSGFSGIAFLSPEDVGSTGASVFLAGERTVAETRDLAATTPDAELEPLVAPTPTAEPVQIVDLVLLEWMIDMPAETRAGQVNFVITNEGAEAHSVVIESGGVVVAELDNPLDPGESSVLSAVLAEGEYVVYCPVNEGEHRDEGMEATLVVVP
ncbi:MAG: cupredoxin domain-containing protein [Chloroflexia bacterium]|nr:cupredoxin domain-containing protein [Chloroflexia bacterium]